MGERGTCSSAPEPSAWRASTHAPADLAQKYEIWPRLITGELSHGQAAQRHGVDRATIIRLRQAAKDGALAAL